MNDTDKLIKEVQKRPALWDSADKSHNDRIVKQKAWLEVAENCFGYEEWSTFTNQEKKENMDTLKKKWKFARDYYVREKNRQNEVECGMAAKRRKTCPYFDSLQFLKINVNKQPRSSFSRPDFSENTNEDSDFIENNEEEEIDIKFHLTEPHISIFEPLTSQQASSESTGLQSMNKPQTMSPFQESILQKLNKNEDDPNLYFLLSILPEMSTMTDRQNFEFRMEVMQALNKVKYKLPNQLDLTNPDGNIK